MTGSLWSPKAVRKLLHTVFLKFEGTLQGDDLLYICFVGFLTPMIFLKWLKQVFNPALSRAACNVLFMNAQEHLFSADVVAFLVRNNVHVISVAANFNPLHSFMFPKIKNAFYAHVRRALAKHGETTPDVVYKADMASLWARALAEEWKPSLVMESFKHMQVLEIVEARFPKQKQNRKETRIEEKSVESRKSDVKRDEASTSQVSRATRSSDRISKTDTTTSREISREMREIFIGTGSCSTEPQEVGQNPTANKTDSSGKEEKDKKTTEEPSNVPAPAEATTSDVNANDSLPVVENSASDSDSDSVPLPPLIPVRTRFGPEHGATNFIEFEIIKMIDIKNFNGFVCRFKGSHSDRLRLNRGKFQ